MSYTQIYYHLVFSTKNRIPALPEEKQKDLYRYIWGIINNKKCHLYRINGMEDHVHLFFALHQTVALADLIQAIKSSSSSWIKKENILPSFPGWQSEYAAFTKSRADKDHTIEYIKNQKEHHHTETSLDELRRLLMEEGIDFDERYLK